ncbi:spore gernimation protein [Paenibacillus glucanolyticus]|jgi:spore germination protein (amino acid permease)|uniref:GerAB/ArcD/ProY family transporter n=1 Tax=Paenibacillus TaxID=44249 RepID=UPI0003E28D6F|nr:MULTISPECIES: endospore germination permease [Paenibacillus]ANA82683.1 spore gernimation protein [Paenibacillus glucanolyticus]AVV58576.1 spore gernimation protein [Paenibacillus glucanolyticus]ETT40145.1 spore germination protein [Paenibacillus sp. FSL R5-808]MPY17470.1 GerAB/ArcD/ProY family transporter [Paenibacillus glucanolyticus]OMF76312.1 spore gernimation protein [Paenibacillus glucanolyticus]
MPTSKKISIIDVFFIMLLSLGITNHVILIPLLLQAASRDAWMGTIVTMILHIGWVYILYFIMKRTHNQSIFAWFQEHFGKTVGRIFITISSFYFFVMAMVILRETTTWIRVTYLPQTPKTVVSLVIVLLCVYVTYNGIRSIAIISGILLPVVWLLGHFVAVSNLEYKDYSLLTPLFVEGYTPMLNSMVIAAGGFMEMIVLIFFQHHMKRRMNYFYIVLLSLLLGGLTLGPLMGAIATFGPTPAMQARYPAYDQWMLVTITKYITHVDFLALYQWISGTLIRISLFLFIITDGMDLKKPKHRAWTLLALGVTLSILTLNSTIDRQIELFVLGKYSLAFLCFVASLTLVIAVAVLIKAKNKGGRKHEAP